jgi:lipoprotein-releasing system permease protein
MIVPINFAFNLLEDSLSISALEVKITADAKLKEVQEKIKTLMGKNFLVKDRFEQKELFYRIMKSEKWAIFMILGFILIIASFNVIGSLAILIIEKKKDIGILYSMGADPKTISRIFQFEGLMISIFGGLAGLILGLFVCLVQQKFGLVKLGGNGSFIIDAYPVSIHLLDIACVFVTVLSIGFVASWYTVKFIIHKYLSDNQTNHT